MTPKPGTRSAKSIKVKLATTSAVAILAAAALVPAVAAPALAADSPYDINESVTSWATAAARLGTAGSLWEPMNTAGLRQSSKVEVISNNLVITKGTVTSGDTYAGATYGRPAKGFQISEKWADTGFAAEPASSTSLAKVAKVKIKMGEPGTQTTVTAQVYANCFKQPANSNPKEIPSGFRCKKSDVLATVGVVAVAAVPA